MKRSILGIASTLLFLVSLGSWAADTTRTISRETIVARYATPASKFLDIEGIKLHYQDEGTGPVVLLVHGTLGSVSDWDEWATLLKPSYRVIRLDLPAFGISGEMPSGNYSVDRMLSLIDTLMDTLSVERFAIVGISYGGLVSFRYAATRTDRVTALILLNSAGIQYGSSSAAAKAVAKPGYNLFTDPTVTSEDVMRFYKDYINDPAQITPALIQRKLDYLNVVNRAQEGVIARKLYERGDPERVLAHVRAPSLVLWGEANNALQTKTAGAFIAALKNACSTELISYPGAGHYINLDRPLETVKDAKTFLDKNLGPASQSKPACKSPRP